MFNHHVGYEAKSREHSKSNFCQILFTLIQIDLLTKTKSDLYIGYV